MAKLGIDLGTSNSAAALVYDHFPGTPEIVEPSVGSVFGNRVYPSYVAFDRNGVFSIAGLDARDRYLNGSDLVIRHFKRLLGRPYDFVAERLASGDRAFKEFEGRLEQSVDGSILVRVGDALLSVQEIASHLLRAILLDAHAAAERRGEVIDALAISLPAGIDDSQRQATITAARMAGVERMDIAVIEEPTAAALAKGANGTVLVVDMGAGTTDVVLGHMSGSTGVMRLVLSQRKCDDLLGGSDMDELLRDVVIPTTLGGGGSLEDLPTAQRLRLMARIEETKINCVMAGSDRDTAVEGRATIALNVMPKNGSSVRVHRELSERELDEIVAPLVSGRTHSVKALVEAVLLEAAGGDVNAVPRVVRELDHVILLGGPCKMLSVRRTIRQLLESNVQLVREIDALDRDDPSFLEGVTVGAALSQLQNVRVTTTVPYTVHVLSDSEMVPAIAAGTPYRRETGVTGVARVSVDRGPNNLWIVSERSGLRREWTMRRHMVNVSQSGSLDVSLVWGEGGTETSAMRVSGAGLDEAIGFPGMSKEATLGAEWDEWFRNYIGMLHALPEMIADIREPLIQHAAADSGNRKAAEKAVTEWLWVPEHMLERCSRLVPEEESPLTESEIGIGTSRGFYEMRNAAARQRGLTSERVVAVMNTVLGLMIPQASREDLVSGASEAVEVSRGCPACERYASQLEQWVSRMKSHAGGDSAAAGTATALAALADCLKERGAIDEERHKYFMSLCWRFVS